MILRKKISGFLLIILLLGFAASWTFKSAEIKNNDIVVLYTEKDPIYPDLPKNCCKYQKIEDFVSNGSEANTVIFSGHGEPPVFATYSSEKVSEIISSYKPELIIINSCFGASTPLMEKLVKSSEGAFVVASPFQIYIPGYVFGRDFFNTSLEPSQRAKAVKIDPDYPIIKWKINKAELLSAREQVFKMDRTEFKKRLKRRTPPLVRVPFPNSLDKDSELLVMLSVKEAESILKKK